jgi:hypothetical protein
MERKFRMPSFVVRVELHGATRDDYEDLHAAMSGQGFSQRIRAHDGRVFELPPAEYVYDGNLTRADVLSRAGAAAKTAKTSFAVLVTESNGSTWTGLRQVAVAA